MWACMLFQHIEAAGAGDGVFYKQERFSDHSMGGMADQTIAWALSVSYSIKKKSEDFQKPYTLVLPVHVPVYMKCCSSEKTKCF